jgi:hypothetical protein
MPNTKPTNPLPPRRGRPIKYDLPAIAVRFKELTEQQPRLGRKRARGKVSEEYGCHESTVERALKESKGGARTRSATTPGAQPLRPPGRDLRNSWPPDNMTPRECAEYMGVSTRWLWDARSKEEGPRYFRCGRVIRYPKNRSRRLDRIPVGP